MNYYDENAQEFFDGTVDADMSPNYNEFLNVLDKNSNILDCGCGSGRDILNFKNLGYSVTAIDGSSEMCRLASRHCGEKVYHMQFLDINFKDEFDGIWASASLLHVSSEEMGEVLFKLKKSLKSDGYLYASFKYGDFEGIRNERYFNDYTEITAKKLFEKNGFETVKIWITSDARKGREDEKWVNILVKK